MRKSRSRGRRVGCRVNARRLTEADTGRQSRPQGARQDYSRGEREEHMRGNALITEAGLDPFEEKLNRGMWESRDELP